MLLAIACGSLALASLLYVFWVTPEKLPAKSPAERERELLEEKKEVVYEGLRDLQMEYRMGKLSDHDYQQLKRHYQEQLAEVLDASRRAADQAPPPAPAFIPGLCKNCGRQNPAENRFCGSCGAKLQPVENA